jgi:threonine/homoserine/homoserine lactone efflux protein
MNVRRFGRVWRRFGLACARTNPKFKAFMWSLLKEFFKFSRQEKKWWLIPLIVLLVLLGAIILFTANSGIAWALYPFL